MTAGYGAFSENEEKEQLLAQSHHQSAGRLASGFIHYLNNSLGVLFGYLEMAMEDCPPDSDLATQLQYVEKAADKVRDVVSQFHYLCRKADDQIIRFDIGDESRKLIQSLELLFPKAIEIRVSWPREPILVRGRVSRWQQALLHILLNARDALQDGGTITLEFTSMATADSCTACLVIGVDGQDQGVERKMTGCDALASDSAQAIMGAHPISQIVRDMGGRVVVSSDSAKGIILYLPIS